MIYLGYSSEVAQEGGQARNNAFWRYFSSWNSLKKFNLNTNSRVKRKRDMLYFWLYLYFLDKKTVFIHQVAIVSLFYLNNPKLKKIGFKFCNYLLTRVASRNRLIIEANDLYYEQSIDLKLDVDENMRLFQSIVYGVEKAHYIFASNKMAEYAQLVYQVKSVSTILNGALLLQQPADMNLEFKYNLDKNKIWCVYAGSLNRGRQIEDLIQIFGGIEKVILILLGDMGEWLMTEALPENICYIGVFEETQAMQIVANCDLGVIPYSSAIHYYNLCYPTKASFYVNAGIPFLSTPLQELMTVFGSMSEVIKFAEIYQWAEIIKNLDKGSLACIKSECLKNKMNYSWDRLINEGLTKLDLYEHKNTF